MLEIQEILCSSDKRETASLHCAFIIEHLFFQ